MSYDVKHCETCFCFCFSALLATMSFISLWRGSHMSATGMPAWWWTSVRHQWLSWHFMESSVGVLGDSWCDIMQWKSVPWLRTSKSDIIIQPNFTECSVAELVAPCQPFATTWIQCQTILLILKKNEEPIHSHFCSGAQNMCAWLPFQ